MTNRRHLIRSVWGIFGLSISGGVPACGAATVPNSSPPKIDTSFLKEEPWVKQKLSVDLSAITDPQHMQVIRGAINQIIIFIARLSTLPPGTSNPKSAFTDGAQFRLRLPPKLRHGNHEMRLVHEREFDWVVTDDTKIAVTVDFGIIRTKPEYTDRFVFLLQNGAWKFDRHDWDQPKVLKPS